MKPIDASHYAVIGANIRQARRRTCPKMTLSVLAQQLEYQTSRQLSVSTLSRIENGKQMIDVLDLRALCVVLGVTSDSLLF